MKKLLVTSISAFALLGLAACSDSGGDNTTTQSVTPDNQTTAPAPSDNSATPSDQSTGTTTPDTTTPDTGTGAQ